MWSFLIDGTDGGALSQWGIALVGGLLGSIIGAIIGGIIGGKYAIWAVRTADTLTRSHEAEERADELRARRTALIAELEYILETITEVRGVVKIPMACVKRLNWDFLEGCRLDWYRADSDTVFIKALAKAYRDVVLTNGQLDDHLAWINSAQSGKKYFDIQVVCDALDGVQGSVSALKKLTEEKLASAPPWPARTRVG
jgi:hypothetical protein